MAIVINGSGTLTGLAVGGLPDGTVDAGTLATNSVDSAELIDGAVDSSHLANGAGFNPDGAVVINESGADVDFRIESDALTHAFYLDATDGAISNQSGIFKLGSQTTATAPGWNFNTSNVTPVSVAQGAAIKIGNVTASGMIVVNDTTITGQACVIVTGGGVVTIIGQTSNHFVSGSSPNTAQYGIYNAGGYVTVKNGKSTTVGLSFMTFRTREGQ